MENLMLQVKATQRLSQGDVSLNARELLVAVRLAVVSSEAALPKIADELVAAFGLTGDPMRVLRYHMRITILRLSGLR
jgi:hypothetical protein